MNSNEEALRDKNLIALSQRIHIVAMELNEALEEYGLSIYAAARLMSVNCDLICELGSLSMHTPPLPGIPANDGYGGWICHERYKQKRVPHKPLGENKEPPKKKKKRK